MFFNFKIWYSKQYKLYDLSVYREESLCYHCHLKTKKEVNKIINHYLNELK